MFASLIRDLYDPVNRYNGVSPHLHLDDYIPSQPHVHFHVVRPRRQTSISSGDRLTGDANKFQVMVNVKHFRPDEVDVKTVDNFIVIHGKHEESADEHGFVSREFTRRYQIPDDVEPQAVTSSLSRDGVLTIQAPRKVLEPPPKNERIVPITIQQPAAQEQQQRMEEQAAQQLSEQNQ